MEGNSITLAAAPDVKGPIVDGVKQFVDFMVGNAAFKTLLMVLGGIAIAVCITLLVLRKFWPQTQIGQALNAGGSSVAWCCAGILLGLILTAPAAALPFLAAVLGTAFQVVLDVLAKIFGI